MEKGGKRLVVCCDGTWNEPDQEVHDNPADKYVGGGLGGGYRDCGLSNIALAWLAGRAARHGLEFTSSIAGLQCEAAGRKTPFRRATSHCAYLACVPTSAK